MSKVFVLGAGGWGIGLAMVARRLGHKVILWSHDAEEIREIRAHNENRRCLPGVSLPEGVELTTSLEGVADTDLVILAVPSFAIRSVATRLKPLLQAGTLVVNAGKGLEDGTLKRFSAVLEEELPTARIVVLSGPSHAEEVARSVPTVVTLASHDNEAAELVQKMLGEPRFRLYVNSDVVGVELGGALKNVIALCAGMVDGLGMGDNTKAALMTRGLAEIARLGVAMGAEERTFAGLSGMGDLMVTCGSMHSRNRRAGILLGRGTPVEQAVAQVGTVEGYLAARSAYELSRAYGVDMPIVEQCYRVCYEGLDVRQAVVTLMERPLRYETEPLWMK